MAVTTLKGVVKNGSIVLPKDTVLPESASVYVLIPDESSSRPRIMSPRLKNPSDAKLFIKTVEDDIEESV